MTRIIIKSGWFARNTLEWYAGTDDIGAHVIRLVEELNLLGYSVQFAGDKDLYDKHDLELHLERQFSLSHIPKILVLSEPEFVQPQNVIYAKNKYNFVIDWRTDRAYGGTRIHYKYPRDLDVAKFSSSPNFTERMISVSCIAGNKNTLFPSKYSLYADRQQYIECFSKVLGRQFVLYGGGWDLVNHPVGFIPKLLFRITKLKKLFLRREPLVSYLGRCESKELVMRNSKFTLCIENSSAPGAISEKLIDCFQHGSVPLYLGPTDVTQLIPSGLIINLRDFSNTDQLFEFIKNFSSQDYNNWRNLVAKHAEEIAEEHGIKQYVDKITYSISEVLREIQ